MTSASRPCHGQKYITCLTSLLEVRLGDNSDLAARLAANFLDKFERSFQPLSKYTKLSTTCSRMALNVRVG